MFLSVSILAGTNDWYIETNPTNRNPEAVWSAKGDTDASYEIRYSYLNRTEWAPSTAMTADSVDDYDPMLAFDSSGNRRVAWWSDEEYDRIKYSTLPSSGGSWSAPQLVSSSAQDCRHPSIVIHAGVVAISYERMDASGYRDVIVTIDDGPSPWPESLVAATQSTTELKTILHSVNGHLWIDWIDSDSHLGFSAHVNGSWESAQYESYTGENDIESARQRIRQRVNVN